MWLGLQKQGMRVHKILLVFQSHNFLFYDCMAMNFSYFVLGLECSNYYRMEMLGVTKKKNGKLGNWK